MPRKIEQCSLCDRTSKTHRISVEAKLCNPCEVALNYWSHKTPTQLVKRARQLNSFQARMELMLGNVKTTNKTRSRKAA